MLYRCAALLASLAVIAEPSLGAALRFRAAGLRGRGRGHAAGGADGGAESASQQRALTATKARNSLGEVIELLATMLHEFDEQSQQDRDNWEAYSAWSQDSEAEKRHFIQEQQALIMATTATLNANRQSVLALTSDLGRLKSEMGEEQASLHDLTHMRHDEHAQFQSSIDDVSKTITALTKATGVLEGHYGSPSASLLSEVRSKVQVALTMFGRKTKSVTEQNVKLLSSMLQVGSGMGKTPDFLNVDGSQYGEYSHQGGSIGVIGMLQDLSAQLESQRNNLIATESASQRDYETTKATKEQNLAHLSHLLEAKTARKAECDATIKQCMSTVGQSEHEITESQAYLQQLFESRRVFQEQFSERSTTRTQERSATQAALDALQSVSAGARDAVGLLQTPGGFSFLSLSLDSSVQLGVAAETRLSQALANLIKLGVELKQPVLTELATRLGQDYATAQQASFFDASKFAPVLKLLNDLITRLEEEGAAETSQHEWCETEKQLSEASKEQREKATHQLMATIESLTTNVATLKSEIEALVSEIARVEEETRLAKDIRTKEHAVYTTARADHEEVIAAIQSALSALSGQSFSLLQAPGGGTPFAAYASGASGASSASSMLQDLLGRYSDALRGLIVDEEAAEQAHAGLLARNTQLLEDFRGSKRARTSERRGLLNELGDDKEELKTNLLELHEVGQYLTDLRPSCDDIRSTFEERTNRREAEIAALREALQVISDPTAVA